MTTHHLPFLRVLRRPAAVLALLLLAGCGGGTQYYRLSADGPAPVRAAGTFVAVGPVTLPGYIDRTELVFQSSPNQFQIPTSAVWAGTLHDNFVQTLRDDLGRRLDSGNVVAFPAPSGTPVRYQVEVSVQQFHAVSGVNAILDVSWSLVEPSSGRTLSRHNASYQQQISGDGYDAVVQAESALVAQLADGVAGSLRRR